ECENADESVAAPLQLVPLDTFCVLQSGGSPQATHLHRTIDPTVHINSTGVMVYYIHMIIVASTSAWAGLEEEAPVDEVEAVRINQRGASRVRHYPERMEHKS